MTETKHTPGEWIASCDDDSTEEANQIHAVVKGKKVLIAMVVDAPEIRLRLNGGKEFEDIGSMAGNDALSEVDANARLIAAAPSLLTACLAVQSAIDSMTGEEFTAFAAKCRNAPALIVNAIKKARL